MTSERKIIKAVKTLADALNEFVAQMSETETEYVETPEAMRILSDVFTYEKQIKTILIKNGYLTKSLKINGMWRHNREELQKVRQDIISRKIII